jgi:hypothetical protein
MLKALLWCGEKSWGNRREKKDRGIRGTGGGDVSTGRSGWEGRSGGRKEGRKVDRPG